MTFFIAFEVLVSCGCLYTAIRLETSLEDSIAIRQAGNGLVRGIT